KILICLSLRFNALHNTSCTRPTLYPGNFSHLRFLSNHQSTEIARSLQSGQTITDHLKGPDRPLQKKNISDNSYYQKS
ncbi:hypothetical protein OSV86_23700, partial [Escherichia marmotae]|uniref:hypothetical protein n=1 Tax=Escherichia marmotae TaxID=1499973 RepID=UPI0023B358C3